MARADRRSAQRARTTPPVRRQAVDVEDTMFFPRLRRQAKWMFLFLAIAIGRRLRPLRRRRGRHRPRQRHLGRRRLRRALRLGGREARPRRTRATPRAFRELATAQQAAANTDEAIEALESVSSCSGRRTSTTSASSQCSTSRRPTKPRRARARRTCAPPTWRRGRRSRARSRSTASRSSRTRSRTRVSARLTTIVSTELGAAQQAYCEFGLDVQEDRRREAEGPERPARAGPDCPERQRHCDCHRGVREVHPTSRRPTRPCPRSSACSRSCAPSRRHPD